MSEEWPLRRVAAAVVALGLCLFAFAFSLGVRRQADALLPPHAYNVAAWEVRTFPGKWLYELNRIFTGERPNDVQDADIARFFALTREINSLTAAINDPRTPDTASRTARRDELTAERNRLENRVEATIESRLTAVLHEEGITRTFLDIVWPPVDFEFTTSPATLVSSPRNRIAVVETLLLRTDLTLEQIAAIEAETEARDGVSALAFPTGGVSAYPTIVAYPSEYRAGLGTIAHEWVHNYLFFRPLGFNYYASNELRSLNETVAELIGRELALAVLARWPEVEAPRPAATASPATPSPEQSSPRPRIDLNAELLQLRAEVETMLAAGQVEEAEAHMEAKRRDLAARGIFIRKINQAYFAFTNLYSGAAGNPTARTNPIGEKVDELRRRSASLHEFIERVGGVTSIAELDAALAEALREPD